MTFMEWGEKFLNSVLFDHMVGALMLEISLKILQKRKFEWSRAFAYWWLCGSAKALLSGWIK